VGNKEKVEVVSAEVALGLNDSLHPQIYQVVDLHVPTQPLLLYSRQSLFTCTYVSNQAIEIEPTKFSPKGIQAICTQQKDLIDKLLFKPKKGTLR